ncbi:FecCD family ABC transporter permease [Nocardia paucivorans]|uniref:FecCD family ABC transporter permease n=1 Tax=Nocardia paucivorans TaxID=114259 RepID=UPI000317337D|nr:iron ABC transporter permease [Nocardia paucivorans]
MAIIGTVRRRRLAGLALLAGLPALLILGVAVGSRTISPITAYSALEHALTCPDGLFRCMARSTDEQIVRGMRLPRTALAAVTGMALGLTGALIQGYTRNPLADGGLLGLTAGASFLCALGTSLFALTTPVQYIWLAFAGTLLAGLAVFATSGVGMGRGGPLGLILAGAAMTAFLQALTDAIVTLDANVLDSYRFWVIGDMGGRDASVFWQILPFLVVGMVLALAAAPGLNLLGLGDDMARGLGVHIGRSRALGLTAVVLLCGAATAAVGPIAFLGLAAAHIARSCTGPDHRWLLPYSALFGAAVLLIADIAGRIVARPAELQAGMMLSLLGVPFFIALVRRRKAVNP